MASELRLGNLDARRDWGFAGDYVRAMWMMLSQEKPEDYVISSDATHSVKEFVELAFRRAGLDWEQYVVVDPQFVRPADDPPGTSRLFVAVPVADEIRAAIREIMDSSSSWWTPTSNASLKRSGTPEGPRPKAEGRPRPTVFPLLPRPSTFCLRPY